jgi:hypothetical protein
MWWLSFGVLSATAIAVSVPADKTIYINTLNIVLLQSHVLLEHNLLNPCCPTNTCAPQNQWFISASCNERNDLPLTRAVIGLVTVALTTALQHLPSFSNSTLSWAYPI